MTPRAKLWRLLALTALMVVAALLQFGIALHLLPHLWTGLATVATVVLTFWLIFEILNEEK